MNLLKWKWYRNLFSSITFVKCDGKWIDRKNYIKGKITEVDGKWYSQAFCNCGNELTFSNSFIQERKSGVHFVFDYKCTCCGSLIYFNPDIIPGFLKCSIDGTPL